MASNLKQAKERQNELALQAARVVSLFATVQVVRQLGAPEINSPKSCQVLPSNFSSCICLIGAKSSAAVDTTMPGSSIGSL